MPNDKILFRERYPTQLPKEYIDWLTQPISRFLRIEAGVGLVLLFFTIAALVLANSPWAEAYRLLWDAQLSVQVNSYEYGRSLREWINDALMTLFFFVVALELKRELVLGELRKPRLAALSISAALGGMLVPALVYLMLQFGQPGQHGWGIVMATDTAFVIGCLALMGPRIPKSLRVFMLSLAIVDDIGAILVMGIGYSAQINWFAMAMAAIGFAVIKSLQVLGVRTIAIYFIIGGFIWLAIDVSGIHATVTGVILGLMTPTKPWVSDECLSNIMNSTVDFSSGDHQRDVKADRIALKTAETAAREALSPVLQLEIMLHPWVGYLIMPLFAFANAGISFGVTDITHPVTMAIMLGFVLGKPTGILLFSWLAVNLGIAILPKNLRWPYILAGGMLAGIGFTMALFIANLAFDHELINAAKLGILCASILSVLTGMTLLVLYAAKDSLQRTLTSAPINGSVYTKHNH